MLGSTIGQSSKLNVFVRKRVMCHAFSPPGELLLVLCSPAFFGVYPRPLVGNVAFYRN